MKPHLLLFGCLCLLLAACGKEPETTASVSATAPRPVMSARNIEVIFSDSGRIQAKVTGIVLNRYLTPESYMEFPRGFKITIFDSLLHTGTTIKASYGKRKDYSRIMEARGNVVVRNEVKKQQLNTEQLTWDENQRMIFTSEPVRITTLDKVIFGRGLRSNESFSDYTILHVYGQMMVKKDSI